MCIKIFMLRFVYKPLCVFLSLFIPNSKLRRKLRQTILYSRDFPYPHVLSIPETVKLLQNGASIARLGDGEFNLALGSEIYYQKNSPEIQRRMIEILKNTNQRCLVAIPPKPESGFFREYFTRCARILNFMRLNTTYANANISRNSDFLVNGITEYRKIWENRRVVFIYSSAGRFEITPEIFSNILEYEHIDVPPIDAFEQYKQIMQRAKSYPHDRLFLISCGSAATVIAYDLANLGYQAIDIGHLPNCYANQLGNAPMPEDLPVSK